MTRTDLLAVLAEIGVQPSKKLGQNFLIDANMLGAMIRDAAPRPGETILEIGPGTGVLTERLLAAGVRLTAVEYDHRLAEFLRSRFADSAHFRLLEADACDVDFAALMGPVPFRCVANLPYAVSSILVARLISLDVPPTGLFVLLQKEMADRLAASPGTKQYGGLTVQVQSLYQAKVLRRLPPDVFWPPPEVSSSFLQLTRLANPLPLNCSRGRFAAFVRQAFSQRRKQMAGTLGKGFGREAVVDALVGIGADTASRPEALSPDQFVRLANRLIRD